MENSENPFFSVLIVAGGHGLRFGDDTPKQYHDLNGLSVLQQSIKAFSSFINLSQLKIVCDPRFNDYLVRQGITQFASAGETRKESVYNGLQLYSTLSSTDIILIHDAVRPLICTEDIENLLRETHLSGAATLAVPVADSLIRKDGTSVDRTDLFAVQTPQGFHFGLISEAHSKFKDRNDFTDDAGLVRALGHPVKIVPGHRQNIKITTPDDLEMARKLMKDLQNDIRTALGFDVHAFDPVKPGPIRLGGVDIPHSHSLSGHSDADVGLHAITDALLGTIAAGDIGQHFPPSDPQWKGADSSLFMNHAVGLVKEKKGNILLIDLTFMCEMPKIGPYREAMQKAISRVTGISEDRISIKATTTEKLGFTGRGEGIAAQALVTVAF